MPTSDLRQFGATCLIANFFFFVRPTAADGADEVDGGRMGAEDVAAHRKVAGQHAVDVHAEHVDDSDEEHKFVGAVVQMLRDGEQAGNVQ